jgi:glycosyltransferase involved in cell wall biosynthesis
MNNRKPFFSVVIPTLNEEKFLPYLLESLTMQTYRDFETVVVDGSSSDQTVNKAETFKKKLPSIKVITCRASLPHQRNQGAINTGGQWLVFVDADSIFLPYAFERIHNFITREKRAVFTTWFTPDYDTSKDALVALFGNVTLETMILIKRPFTPGPLTVVRRDIFEKIGGYSEDHAFHEDIDLGLRLKELGVQPAILREALYVWSQRRFRKENKLKVLQQYLLSILPVLFMKRSFKFMPGYVMGGQLYDSKKKPLNIDRLRKYEMKIKSLVKELFE